jgi:NADH-quinone oxidoreductase subunit J
MIQTLAFYLFAALVIASAVMVITARNPVHSVLWLILAFFNAAGLMILIGAEFIAMLLVIVYVGAVAVLFLFVVMMLDIDFATLRAGFVKNFPLGLAIAGILLAELLFGLGAHSAGGLCWARPMRRRRRWPMCLIFRRSVRSFTATTCSCSKRPGLCCWLP